MQFSVSRNVVGDVAVLTLEGRSSMEAAKLFRDAAVLAITEGYKKVILDYGAVTYTDSMFLSTLVEALVSLRNVKGELVLVNVQDRILQVFEITKLKSCFQFFATVPQALEHFGVPHSQAASKGTGG